MTITKSANGRVIIVDKHGNTNSFSGKEKVLPHPDVPYLVIISENSSSESLKDGFKFAWLTVSNISVANRNEFIQELSDNFFFELDQTAELDNRITALENTTKKVAYYAEITTLSGQISLPTGATILLDQWANGVDAVLSAIQGGKPDYKDTGVDITTFDSSGNYVISGSLPAVPSALIYYLLVNEIHLENLDIDKVIEYAEVTNGGGGDINESLQFTILNL